MFEEITPGGVILGLLISGLWALLVHSFKWYRRRQIKNEIRDLQFERKHLEEIKRSPTALIRSSFRGVFFILACLAILGGITPLTLLFNLPKELMLGIQGGLSIGIILISGSMIKRYTDLANYQKSIEIIDKKITELEGRAL